MTKAFQEIPKKLKNIRSQNIRRKNLLGPGWPKEIMQIST